MSDDNNVISFGRPHQELKPKQTEEPVLSDITIMTEDGVQHSFLNACMVVNHTAFLIFDKNKRVLGVFPYERVMSSTSVPKDEE